MNDPTPDLRALVDRMAKARNNSTRTYMPTALLAVIDLAEQGKVREGVVQVADYKPAFQRLMLEVWPTREDMWFRPMLHAKQHAMWQPLLHGKPVEYDKRRISSLTERSAEQVADAFRLDAVLAAALREPRLRASLRRDIYALLEHDDDEQSTRLAEVHSHQDAQRNDSALLGQLQAWEHRHEERGAYEDLRRHELSRRAVRDGQAEFRRLLLAAYKSRCAMSGADAPRALEAAHILPYRGPHQNRVSNGLLLRGDLHTLFDDGLLTVDCGRDFAIDVSRSIGHTVYGKFREQNLRLPERPADRPDPEALAWHRRKAPPPEDRTR